MKWLFWREYRLNRLILITGAVLLLLPCVTALIIALRWVPKTGANIVELFFGASVYGLALSQLTLALLGGNAMAGERADRSAEYVAYLPVSRLSRLICKLGLAAVTALVIWGVSLPVLAVLRSILPRNYVDEEMLFLAFVAITGLVFFCVSWFISSLQSSPTFAICGGLVTPLVIVMIWQAVAWLSEMRQGPEFDQIIGIGYTVTCLLVAVICFSVGTWYYLRRIEP
jgi:ABC-type transport system involved in multi-copper enzyme maturation permease subunit